MGSVLFTLAGAGLGAWAGRAYPFRSGTTAEGVGCRENVLVGDWGDGCDELVKRAKTANTIAGALVGGTLAAAMLGVAVGIVGDR